MNTIDPVCIYRKETANMKKKILIILVTVLAVLMMGSVVLTALSVAKGSDGFASGKYSFDLLTEEKTFNTTTPVFMYDFTSDAIQSTFANTMNMAVYLPEFVVLTMLSK